VFNRVGHLSFLNLLGFWEHGGTELTLPSGGETVPHVGTLFLDREHGLSLAEPQTLYGNNNGNFPEGGGLFNLPHTLGVPNFPF